MFIDDISVVTNGTKDEHLDKMRETLKTLDHAEVHLKAGNVYLRRMKLSG